MADASRSARVPREEPEPEGFEALLTRCIEAWTDAGPDAARRVAEEHPVHARRALERLADLERLGLLDDEGRDDGPLRFGPYRVVRRLGQGGMSVVYLAEDERDGRRVALKAGHRPLAPDDRAGLRFEREVRAVSQLDHPNIVAVRDVGAVGGRPYFTMEYVEGATLARVVEELRRGPGSVDQLTGDDVRRAVQADVDERGGRWARTYVEEACRLVLDVAEGLAHAHAAGVVHRDVKPSNVMVRADGRAQLIDLGLARVHDQPTITRSGDFAGTPYYVSPEQVAGRPGAVDARSDVYSLGVTLFELLTLARPFEGSSTAAIFEQIRRREPPLPSRWNSAVPRPLEAICLRALEKDPAARYAGARELADDLRRFLDFQPVRARRVSRLRRGARFLVRNPALGAAATLGALVLVGLPVGLAWANAEIRAQRDRAERSAAEARRQAELSEAVGDFLVELFRPLEDEDDALELPALLARGVERIGRDFADRPLLRAALLEATGRAYCNLGLQDEAIPLLDRSFALRHSELGEQDRDVAGGLLLLAQAHLAEGDERAALALAERALATWSARGEGGSLEAVACLRALATAERRLGRLDAAERHLRAVVAAQDAAGAAVGERARAEVLEELAALARERGAPAEARGELEAALALRRREWSPDPDATARTMLALAEVLDGAEGARAEELRAGADALLAGADPAADGAAPAPDPSGLLPAWVDAYDASFQLGITALQAREHRRAIDAFERCMTWKPRSPVCAYNIACGYALEGDLDEAHAWLARAADWGFGARGGSMETLDKDQDLEPLRGDPRWSATVARIEAALARVEAWRAEPAVYLPDALPEEGGWPLLVVLHDSGATKRDVVEGPWRDVADALGCALLAPSAPTPTHGDPARGMDWGEDARDFLDKAAVYEAEVLDAVRAFCARVPVDRASVCVAGEGFGALPALDLALEAPGLFRGLLLRNGPLPPPAPEARVRAAASLGLRVGVLVDRAEDVPGLADGTPAAEHARRLERWLAARALGPLVGGAGDPGGDAGLVALAAALLRR